MLIIPIIETLQTTGRVDWNAAAQSVQSIVRDMAEQRPPSELPSQFRDSISAIRAFWRRFCDIPPFCAPTNEEPPR